MRTVQGVSVALQAHRGVSADYPENTMAAFRAAAELGYDTVELDPAFTADGVCVVLHDRTVNRTGRDERGRVLETPTPIAQLTWQEASRLDFGLWKSPRFAGEGLPLLSQALSFAREANMPLKLDNKVEGFTPAQIGTLFSVVQASGAEALCGFTCTRMEYLRAVTERFPHAPIHYDGVVDEARLRQVMALSAGHEVTAWLRWDCPATAWCKTPAVTPQQAALVRALGARLGLWILQDEADILAAHAQYAPDLIEVPG